MSDRLPELLRQRALLQEHLAWLEREITQESSLSVPPPTAPHKEHARDESGFFTKNTSPAPMPSAPPPLPPQKVDAPVEKIIEQYQRDPRALGEDTRKGCLRLAWIAGAAFTLLTLLGYALYARHLGRWW